MAFVIGLMMAAFGVAGVCLLCLFFRELAQRLARLPYLERVEGEVTAVKTQDIHFQGDMGPSAMHFPVITFRRHGVPQTFTSEFGDGKKSRFFIGQKIRVRFDPAGSIPPMVDSWFGLWLRPVIGIFGGFMFLGGVALLYVTFGSRAFGW